MLDLLPYPLAKDNRARSVIKHNAKSYILDMDDDQTTWQP